MEAELAKAYARATRQEHHGLGLGCDIVIHRGAGAYEAGEETALIESLEGKRAQPRIEAAVSCRLGPLQQAGHAVNNVETLCNLPPIVLNGAEWFASLGPEERRTEAVLRQRPREEARRSRPRCGRRCAT